MGRERCPLSAFPVASLQSEVQSSCPVTCANVEISLWQVNIAVSPCAYPVCAPCWQLEALGYGQQPSPVLSESGLYRLGSCTVIIWGLLQEASTGIQFL